MHDNEPVPGTSQQTETPQQEDLHAWLTKTHSRLRFLSQIEHSAPLANLISSFDKKLQSEACEKTSIEFLLALDDFIAKEKDPSLSIQFFIEEILKNCRLLIDEYRDTYAKLISLEETVTQPSLTEDAKQLQIKLLDLNKEKKQLEKLLLPDVELTRLIELTTDLKKFRLELDRDFKLEIAMHEAELKVHTQELDEINEQAAKIEEELTFPIDQLEANLRINQRKLYYSEGDLYTLKQIRIDDIIKKLLSQLELENTRLSLISELKECDPIKILKIQIEHPNTKQEDLRTESKIKKDLAQNAQTLDDITDFFKNIIQLVPINNNNIIKNFLKKIQSILNLNVDKNALETKQTKINEELIDFLQLNESELIELLKKLTDDKQEEVEKLQIEKQNLKILGKKNKLKSQISEVEEKIQATKDDQYIFSILEDNNLINSLINLERLQKITDNTIREIDELQNQIAEIEKKITELEREDDKKDVAKLEFECNKKKINSRENITILKEKKIKLNFALKEQLENRKTEQKTKKVYGDPIEKVINRICDSKTQEWQNQSTQTQDELRKKEAAINTIMNEIEKQKSNSTHKEQEQLLNKKLNWQGDLLLQWIVKLSKEDNTQQKHNLFDSLKTQLIDLKKEVENPDWNKLGWGFFFKKVPDGIQKIRKIFDEIPFDTSESETNIEQNNFMMLSLFSEIYLLIKQKNSSTPCLRSSTVKKFYQSLQKSLTQINNQFLALQEPDVEMHDAAQPTCSTFPH